MLGIGIGTAVSVKVVTATAAAFREMWAGERRSSAKASILYQRGNSAVSDMQEQRYSIL
jgi:hypothetical protein